MRAGIVVLALVLAACSGAAVAEQDSPPPAVESDWSPAPRSLGDLEGIAFVDDGELLLRTASGYKDFLPGVNIGPTIPGRQPGEQAIRREDFRRWFPQIHDLGLRVIRVYTIMPPSFYEELRSFNLGHETSPLYLMHGVWVPQAPLHDDPDLFRPLVSDTFLAEIERAVGVVHGDASLPDRPGHAHGTYTADVSRWLMSWVVGVEWDPFLTAASDEINAGVAPHDGTYFMSVPGSSPTETWLARGMDHLASLEADHGHTLPIAFVNWPTTDPLEHPSEPLEREDLVGVDANHVLPTDAWPGGTFASYHAYPYYPDFQRYEEGIDGFVLDGDPDNYAGYLTKLRDHHAEAGLPVLVTEVGVPSSIGNAHLGPQGRDQGGHSEQDAMRINGELVSVIERLGLGGALLFEWADEWFKFTWNTIDLELPSNRRQLWVNEWTNEAHFGLLAVEPGDRQVVTIDGDGAEWDAAPAQAILESASGVREVKAMKDEGYLYLRLILDEPLDAAPLVVGFDLLDGGASPLPTGHEWEGADTTIVVEDGRAQASVRATNDPTTNLYGSALGMIPFETGDLDPDSAIWKPQSLMLNRPLTIPTTGESFPAELLDVATLPRGTTDPAAPDFDARTVWAADGTVVEMRVPYATIGFADPSSLQALRAHPDGSFDTVTVERVGIAVAHGENLQVTRGYAWEPWNAVDWHERPKAGLDSMAEAVRASLRD